MNKKRAIISVAFFCGVIAVSTYWFGNYYKYASGRKLTDDALLALIKNDLNAFERFIQAGGLLHDNLPEIDGKNYTVSQGIAYFERSVFGNYLNQNKIEYVDQHKHGPFDIMTIAVEKNNPELMNQLSKERVNYKIKYGKNGWSLLHMASAWCSHKITSILHEKGKINWDDKASDGTTPLTLAAKNDCLPMLSYWKERGADFRARDGKGQSALSILKTKKDAALAAFAESFEERKIATVTKTAQIPDFYKKRKIPKEQVVDHAAMLEPEDRPLEATETAEFSEFAD